MVTAQAHGRAGHVQAENNQAKIRPEILIGLLGPCHEGWIQELTNHTILLLFTYHSFYVVWNGGCPRPHRMNDDRLLFLWTCHLHHHKTGMINLPIKTIHIETNMITCLYV